MIKELFNAFSVDLGVISVMKKSSRSLYVRCREENEVAIFCKSFNQTIHSNHFPMAEFDPAKPINFQEFTAMVHEYHAVFSKQQPALFERLGPPPSLAEMPPKAHIKQEPREPHTMQASEITEVPVEEPQLMEPPTPINATRRIFISNLLDEDLLKGTLFAEFKPKFIKDFSAFGEIEDINVEMKGDSRVLDITYSNEQEAGRAFHHYSGKVVDGKVVEVTFEEVESDYESEVEMEQ
ncbi:hypothetical protein P9112_000110 [Eukaryota sp. TZLM1-RC]